MLKSEHFSFFHSATANNTMAPIQGHYTRKSNKLLLQRTENQRPPSPEHPPSAKSHSEHPPRPALPLKSKTERLLLVAEVAVTGLGHSALCPEESADFYEGLSSILSPPTSEAAKYTATCIRECQRAQRDFLAALRIRKETAGK